MATATSKNKPLYTERARQKRIVKHGVVPLSFRCCGAPFPPGEKQLYIFFRKWRIIIHVNAASHCELYGIAAAKKSIHTQTQR